MADYGAMMRLPDVEAPPWYFLTAQDGAAIGPVLAAYNQPVARKADFLDPRLLMNDLKTLQMEAP